MAFDIMSPETSVVQGKLPHPNINRNAIRRPADMREGKISTNFSVKSPNLCLYPTSGLQFFREITQQSHYFIYDTWFSFRDV